MACQDVITGIRSTVFLQTRQQPQEADGKRRHPFTGLWSTFDWTSGPRQK